MSFNFDEELVKAVDQSLSDIKNEQVKSVKVFIQKLRDNGVILSLQKQFENHG